MFGVGGAGPLAVQNEASAASRSSTAIQTPAPLLPLTRRRDQYVLRVGSVRGSANPRWLKGFKKYMKENSQFDNVNVRLHLNKKNKIDLSVIEETGGKKSRKKKRSGKLDDLVTLGDAWLEKAVKEGSVQPIIGAEQTRWWDEMPAKCKKLVLRDREGQAKGKLGSKKATYVWGVPYKWGCLCMLARQDKLDKLGKFWCFAASDSDAFVHERI